MRKGDVPVPYIVALILAVIIIGIIGYWFFTVVLSGSNAANEAYCTTLATKGCMASGNPDVSTDSKCNGMTFDCDKLLATRA